MKLFNCQKCDAEILRKNPAQKYCVSCSEEVSRATKSKWAKANPQPAKSPEQIKQAYTMRRKRAIAIGKAASIENQTPVSWDCSEPIDWIWSVRVAVPFTYAFSKNHIYRMGRTGHVTLREECKSARLALGLAMRQALAGQKIATNKIWLDIFVQKPDHKGDAVNVVDTVCDSLKEVIGLDDRWYSIRRLDWEIVKQGGMLYVGICQDSDVDCQVCSLCGQMLAHESFSKNASNIAGISRECNDCRNSIRRKNRP